MTRVQWIIGLIVGFVLFVAFIAWRLRGEDTK
jgi:hypothetical protein